MNTSATPLVFFNISPRIAITLPPPRTAPVSVIAAAPRNFGNRP